MDNSCSFSFDSFCQDTDLYEHAAISVYKPDAANHSASSSRATTPILSNSYRSAANLYRQSSYLYRSAHLPGNFCRQSARLSSCLCRTSLPGADHYVRWPSGLYDQSNGLRWARTHTDHWLRRYGLRHRDCHSSSSACHCKNPFLSPRFFESSNWT